MLWAVCDVVVVVLMIVVVVVVVVFVVVVAIAFHAFANVKQSKGNDRTRFRCIEPTAATTTVTTISTVKKEDGVGPPRTAFAKDARCRAGMMVCVFFLFCFRKNTQNNRTGRHQKKSLEKIQALSRLCRT